MPESGKNATDSLPRESVVVRVQTRDIGGSQPPFPSPNPLFVTFQVFSVEYNDKKVTDGKNGRIAMSISREIQKRDPDARKKFARPRARYYDSGLDHK